MSARNSSLRWDTDSSSDRATQSPAAPSESDLVSAAKALDEDAWSTIYALYREKIYAYIFFRIGDRHASEDLTADVFIRAIRGIAGYEWRGTPLLAWLYRIAQNTTIDYRSQQARRPSSVSSSELENADKGVDYLGALDERNDMMRAIRMLTDDQQQVLLLRFYGGLSTAQVASVMKKPQTAVKALQARGLRSLRRLLSESDGGER